MNLPQGTETAATGLVATVLLIWSKFRLLSKKDFEIHRASCQGDISKKLDAITHTQEKIYDKMDVFTKHMGKVEGYMEMKK